MNELLAALVGHPFFAGPAIDPGVQVALVGGIFGLGGIAMSVLLDRGSRRNRAQPTEGDPDDSDELIAELRLRAVASEARAERYREERDQVQRNLLDAAVRERRLREFVAMLGYNPDTLRRRSPRATVEDPE